MKRITHEYIHPMVSMDTCVAQIGGKKKLMFYPRYRTTKYSAKERIQYHGFERVVAVLSINVPYDFYSKFIIDESMNIPEGVINGTESLEYWSSGTFGMWFPNCYFQIQGGDIIGCTDEDGFKKLTLAAKLGIPSLSMNLMVVDTRPRIVNGENIDDANVLCEPHIVFSQDEDSVSGMTPLTKDEELLERIAILSYQDDPESSINKEVNKQLEQVVENLKRDL